MNDDRPKTDQPLLVRWLAATTCLRGRDHERAGTPCEDRLEATEHDDAQAIVLADGAGSARLAELGARHVAQTASASLAHRFDELFALGSNGLADALLGELREQIARVAEDHRAAREELAATLLFVAVKAGRFIAGNLGDGVVGCARGGEHAVLCAPQRGEFATQTFFVTSRDAAERIKVAVGPVGDIDTFVLMTDGAAQILHDRRAGQLAPAVMTIASWLDAHPQRTASDALTANLIRLRGGRTGDDCSVAVIRRVAMSVDTLRSESPAYKRDFLRCGTVIGADNRLSVASACLSPASPPPDALAVSREVGLAPATVRGHLRAIRRLQPDLAPPGVAAAGSSDMA